jgi:enoyl-CoA hydratase/carnithine racemase
VPPQSYLGDRVSVEQDEPIGLVNKVVPAISLMGEARALAARLAAGRDSRLA